MNKKELISETVREVLNSEIRGKLTLSIAEAARVVGVGRDTIYNLVNAENSDFPFFKVNSKAYVNRELLIDWVNKITNEKRIIS